MSLTLFRKRPMTDHDYMRLALSLARKAKGFTSPNPCVGAVVVKDQVVVGLAGIRLQKIVSRHCPDVYRALLSLIQSHSQLRSCSTQSPTLNYQKRMEKPSHAGPRMARQYPCHLLRPPS